MKPLRFLFALWATTLVSATTAWTSTAADPAQNTALPNQIINPTPPADNIVRDAEGHVDYIVELNPDVPLSYPEALTQLSRFATYHKPRVVNAITDFESLYGFRAHSLTSWTLPTFSVFLDEDQAAELGADTRVKAMTPNRRGKFSITAVPDAGAVWSDSVSNPVQSWGKVAVNSGSIPSGGTSVVYVLDAGVGQHVDLNVVEWVNPNPSHTYMCGTRAGVPCTPAILPYVVGCYTHATAVAGIIGAKGIGVTGINPGVKVVSVVAPDSIDVTAGCLADPDPDHSSVMNGLDWIMSDIASNSRPSVVNLSAVVDSMPTLNGVIHSMTHPTTGAGAVFVQAAGNQYDDACNYAYNNGGAASASDGVLVVGAINNHGQPVVPFIKLYTPPIGFWKDAAALGYDSGSNYGPCVDIWAPGDGIYTTIANPSTVANQLGNTVYNTYGMGSGTSFSAPNVSGLASVLIEKSISPPSTPVAVETAIRTGAYALGSVDSANIAIKISTANPTHPSPANKPYGELILTTADTDPSTSATTTSVNGYKIDQNLHNFTGDAPGAFDAYYNMVVDFHLTGPSGCTVKRTLSSNNAIFNYIVNAGFSFATPSSQAWNLGSTSASTTWNVSSDCFPSGALVTSYTPSVTLSVADGGNFYQGQTGATYTLTVHNSGFHTQANSNVTVTEATPPGMMITSMTGQSGSGWTCSTITCNAICLPAAPKCTRFLAIPNGMDAPPITVTVNIAANAPGTITNAPTVSLVNPPVTVPASHITSISWATQNSLATPRVSHAAAITGPSSSQILVVGGFNNNTNVAYASAERYSPQTNQWTAAGTMQYARMYFTASSVGQRVYVTGGTAGVLTPAEIFDSQTGVWSLAAAPTVIRQGHSATVLSSGKIFVAGGYNATVSAEIYDPTANAWTSAGTPAISGYFNAATLLSDGRVLVTGGVNHSSPIADAEIYDPVAGTWSSVPGMVAPRYMHSATLLSSGKVLVAGGYGAFGNMASVEIYDPVSNSWAAGPSMIDARSGHTAALLPTSGKVLIAGDGGTDYSHNEIYDPSTSIWTSAPKFVTGRTNHTALLVNGKVYAAGGVTSAATPTGTVESYTP